MDMKTYLQQATPEEREALAVKVDSSVGYFYLIAGGHRRPGTDLCKLLVANEPKLTLSKLRPDVWPDLSAADQKTVAPEASEPVTTKQRDPEADEQKRSLERGTRTVFPKDGMGK